MSLSIDKARRATKVREQIELSHVWMKANPALADQIIMKFLREHAGQEVKVNSERREGFTYMTAPFNTGLDLPAPWEQEVFGTIAVKCRFPGKDHAAAHTALKELGFNAQYMSKREDRLEGWVLVLI